MPKQKEIVDSDTKELARRIRKARDLDEFKFMDV